mmetsp:Transcript_75555/g.126000  ORF Transcript_75555/g.126000 Transcript_75555/m.126000 type:complete len:85 (+) Transcript_75555:514-768(+)
MRNRILEGQNAMVALRLLLFTNCAVLKAVLAQVELPLRLEYAVLQPQQPHRGRCIIKAAIAVCNSSGACIKGFNCVGVAITICR